MTKMAIVRRILGITQKELSEITGIDSSTISRLENGIMKPYPGWQRKIADALGWDGNIDELFEEVKNVK
ncbi:helix-turn-helix domain-containing protein [Thermoanaerobacter uzonensis]|uniref:helix-turn-helix domain-containing protein n=1 Tax=Thermoanaerobacter uzonensis TaxID=447593 RepID=UPI003D768497